MRKLTTYPEDSFAFYKDMVASKRNTADDPTYKDRLLGIEGLVQPLFNNYEGRFNDNDLQSLISHPFNPNQKADLLKLYSYKSSIIQKLKIRLTTLEFNQVLNTCQCCTIGEVSSFDHLVPKDEFPEFSVNPKNLFPSCHKCNGYKNVAWRNGGVRTFLNLFLDQLPEHQYLFADVHVEPGGLVNVTFNLNNPYGIDDSIFALLQSHYAHLHLAKRFKENLSSVVVPIANSIKNSRGKTAKHAVVEQIVQTSRDNKEFFGNNYWKSILEIALANNNNFVDFYYDAK